MYKNGNFVKYNADGIINYIDHADTQVKIYSQQLEPREIKHHIKELLPVPHQVAITKAQIPFYDILEAIVCIPGHQIPSRISDVSPTDGGFL